MSRFADVMGVVTLAAAAGSPASSALDPTLGRLLAVVLALVAGAACATVQKPTPLKSLTPADPSRPADWEYKIQIGDELDVKFHFNPARLLPTRFLEPPRFSSAIRRAEIDCRDAKKSKGAGHFPGSFPDPMRT